jgi:hypothetical protein
VANSRVVDALSLPTDLRQRSEITSGTLPGNAIGQTAERGLPENEGYGLGPYIPDFSGWISVQILFCSS